MPCLLSPERKQPEGSGAELNALSQPPSSRCGTMLQLVPTSGQTQSHLCLFPQMKGRELQAQRPLTQPSGSLTCQDSHPGVGCCEPCLGGLGVHRGQPEQSPGPECEVGCSGAAWEDKRLVLEELGHAGGTAGGSAGSSCLSMGQRLSRRSPPPRLVLRALGLLAGRVHLCSSSSSPSSPWA